MIPAKKIGVAPGELPLSSEARLEVDAPPPYYFDLRSLARHGAAPLEQHYISLVIDRISEARAQLAYGSSER